MGVLVGELEAFVDAVDELGIVGVVSGDEAAQPVEELRGVVEAEAAESFQAVALEVAAADFERELFVFEPGHGDGEGLVAEILEVGGEFGLH